MIRFGVLLSYLGVAVMILGGFTCFALFAYGVYASFAKSITLGLVAIGASTALAILARLCSGLLIAGGASMVEKSAMREVARIESENHGIEREATQSSGGGDTGGAVPSRVPGGSGSHSGGVWLFVVILIFVPLLIKGGFQCSSNPGLRVPPMPAPSAGVPRGPAAPPSQASSDYQRPSNSELDVPPAFVPRASVPTAPSRQQTRSYAGYEIRTVQQGKFAFPSEASDERLCPGNICVCEANVQRIVLTARDEAALKINAELAKMAARRCDDSSAAVWVEPEVTYISDRFFSVRNAVYNPGMGAMSACQTTIEAALFDRLTGEELRLQDVVQAKNLSEAYKVIANDILAQERRREPDAVNDERRVLRFAENGGNPGLFIQSRKLMAQFPGYPFSCAQGSAYAGRLPNYLVHDEGLFSALISN